jgi:hypothetical protein
MQELKQVTKKNKKREELLKEIAELKQGLLLSQIPPAGGGEFEWRTTNTLAPKLCRFMQFG